MRRLVLALALASLPFGMAHGQAHCDQREVILLAAKGGYGEVPHSGGHNRPGTLFAELLLSPEGSWTIILSRTDGYTCVVASGIGWDKLGGIPGEDG